MDLDYEAKDFYSMAVLQQQLDFLESIESEIYNNNNNDNNNNNTYDGKSLEELIVLEKLLLSELSSTEEDNNNNINNKSVRLREDLDKLRDAMKLLLPADEIKLTGYIIIIFYYYCYYSCCCY